MTTPKFTMMANDLYPPRREILSNGDGTIPALATAISVWFIFRKLGETTSQKKAAVIVNAATGLVEYQWAVGDTVDPGRYEYQWEVVLAGTKPATFPNDGYPQFVIKPDLG